MLKKALLLSIFFSFTFILSRAQQVELLQQGQQRTSIRGLSIVDDKIAWVSGSRGSVGITNDGGKTWAWQTVKGYERSDFRAVEAFSDKDAVIISSGTPALILKTADGGVTWQEKYRNADTVYFLDAMGFDSPKHGLVLGDPIKNKFLLLETNDGAETWHPFKDQPDALPGEAAFAASGTCLRVKKGEVHIVTGGMATRHLELESSSKKWFAYNLPITHGQASKGAFSIAIAYNWVVVGGNYSKDKIIDSVSCVFNSGAHAQYKLSDKSPAGYQSCVEAITANYYIATGTSGSNLSTDGGHTWAKIDDKSYNVCRKAKKGNLVLLAGDGGKIGVLKL